MSYLKGVCSNKGLAIKLLLFLALILVGVILGTACSICCSYLPCSPTLRLEFMQLVSSICVFIIPSLIAAYLFGTNAEARKTKAKYYLWVVLLVFCALPMINCLTDWNESMRLPQCMSKVEAYLKMMEESAQHLTEQFLMAKTWGGFILNLFVMALLAAVGEELTFRGILQPLFAKKWGNHIAVWLTAFIFSAVHMQFYGFIPRLLLGVMFGYMVVWSSSIYVSMTGHFLNNAIVVCYYFIIARYGELPDLNAIGTGDSWYVAVISVAVTCGIMYAVWRMRIKASGDAHEQ